MKISSQTARRFILGQQGLWPARRWVGKAGTEKAMRTVEFLQLDPLDIGARAHDLILHSRVRGYKKSYYDQLVYREKKFFEWGYWLATRPIEEWPYWSVFMNRLHKGYQKTWNSKARAANQRVLEMIEREGEKRNRDFKGGKVEKQYRGGKESSLALYQLWASGLVVTSNRDRFERFYDLTHRFVPENLRQTVSDEEADLFLMKKALAFHSIGRFEGLDGDLGRHLTPARRRSLRDHLVREGFVQEIEIEGWKQSYFVAQSSVNTLQTLESGKIPKQWRGGDENEVLLLSPLDVVSARGRAKKVFNFDYVWEVYKPESQRKWGYYTLPILWQDRLVGRVEPNIDRATSTMQVRGLWLDEPKLKSDEDFLDALASSLIELRDLFAAEKIEISTRVNPTVRRFLKSKFQDGG